MLKPTVKRGLMLDFVPNEFKQESTVNPYRIYNVNNLKIAEGDIIYMPTRELRLKDNWAVIFGLELAKKYNKKFRIIIILSKIKYSKVQEPFLMEGLKIFQEISAKKNIDFAFQEELPKNIGALVVDFKPLHPQHLPPQVGGKITPIFEVDSHNIIPTRFISNKQEYSAATMRRKIYSNIAGFLTEYPSFETVGLASQTYDAGNLQSSLGLLAQQHNILKDFIKNKLDNYAELKNNPLIDVTSGLSPYLHFGFVAAQRAALEVFNSSASRENKEAFLEELIVRKELADNFCLYSPSFKTFEGILPWAKSTLNAHKNDIRTYLYTQEEFENAKTHDKLWNKIQTGLTQNNRIHGYLRMFWAKKILEWSNSPEEALKIAIYLNDKYAMDGNDPNGYVGILWAIGGLHDRPFTNRLVTGKIRYMGSKKIKF